MSKTANLQTSDGVIVKAPGVGILIAYGATVPANGTAGYATGCIFIQTDALTAPTAVYVNTSLASSAAFRPLTPAAQGAALTAQLTTITPADAAGTPDYAIAAITQTTPFGFASAQEAISVLYVIQNLQVRLAEVEARLEAAGIVAAN